MKSIVYKPSRDSIILCLVSTEFGMKSIMLGLV